jgi:hypothetical protein
MTKRNEKQRPTVTDCLKHPFFKETLEQKWIQGEIDRPFEWWEATVRKATDTDAEIENIKCQCK